MAFLTTAQKIAMLAAMMGESRRGMPLRAVFFLGAGASYAAGVPLADGLKNLVIGQVFEADTPDALTSGRLEDVMQLLQQHGGQDGYHLVANHLRRHVTPSEGQKLLVNLAHHGHVGAVVTTNMDSLIEHAADLSDARITPLVSEEDFASTTVRSSEVPVAHLHGWARDPSTMRGSWTDVGKALSVAKAETLTNLLTSYIPIFVGYAARDPDVSSVLIKAAEKGRRIYWVDNLERPTVEIRDILSAFCSEANYIPLPAEAFFRRLHDALFPVDARGQSNPRPLLRQIASATEEARLERSRGYAFDQAVNSVQEKCVTLLASFAAEIDEAGTDIKVFCGGGTVGLPSDLGPYREILADCSGHWESGPYLEISTGGPNLALGMRLVRRHEARSIKVAAFIVYIDQGRELWNCDAKDVSPLDDIDQKRLHSWLNTTVDRMYHDALARLRNRLIERNRPQP